MHLFSRIPSGFFSVLASKNREIYYDALMLLNNFLKEDNLNIRVDDYISSLISLLEDRNFDLEPEDEIPELQLTYREEGGYSVSIKARCILQRLIRTGWLDREEMEGSFTEIITPRDYAIRVIRLLEELADERIHEYNSLVFSTYSALAQAEGNQHHEMFEALMNAKKNTEHLIYELKGFYHNIRSYLKDIQEQNAVNELLENHFEKFKPLADRIYHPIKTMDSVHRYMSPVIEILENLLESDEFTEVMRKRAMAIRKYEHEEDADKEIYTAINYILDIYRGLGSTTEEIDRRYNSYIKQSIDKMTYMMSADQTIKGKLLDIFNIYASSANNSYKNAVMELLEKNIRINRQYFLNVDSLFHKNIISRRLNETPLEIEQSEIQDVFKKLAGQMNNIYPLEMIRNFIEDIFIRYGIAGDNILFVDSGNITLHNDSSFILLILAVIRSRERGMNYRVQFEEGSVIRDGYLIPKMKFIKAKGKETAGNYNDR
jgi:hypothetical protein